MPSTSRWARSARGLGRGRPAAARGRAVPGRGRAARPRRRAAGAPAVRGLAPERASPLEVGVPQPARPRWWQRRALVLRPAAAVALSAVLLAIGIASGVLLIGGDEEPAPGRTTLALRPVDRDTPGGAAEGGESGRATLETGRRVRVEVRAVRPAGTDGYHELWLLPAAGDPSRRALPGRRRRPRDRRLPPARGRAPVRLPRRVRRARRRRPGALRQVDPARARLPSARRRRRRGRRRRGRLFRRRGRLARRRARRRRRRLGRRLGRRRRGLRRGLLLGRRSGGRGLRAAAPRPEAARTSCGVVLVVVGAGLAAGGASPAVVEVCWLARRPLSSIASLISRRMSASSSRRSRRSSPATARASRRSSAACRRSRSSGVGSSVSETTIWLANAAVMQYGQPTFRASATFTGAMRSLWPTTSTTWNETATVVHALQLASA